MPGTQAREIPVLLNVNTQTSLAELEETRVAALPKSQSGKQVRINKKRVINNMDKKLD